MPYARYTKRRRYTPRRWGSYRRQPYYSGRGVYKLQRSTYLRPIARRIGRYLGGAAGGYFGGGPGRSLGRAVGGRLGGTAADVLKTVTGVGDYYQSGGRSRQANKILAGTLPRIKNVDKYPGAVVLRHREFIQSIKSGSVGNLHFDSFIVNPAQSECFPWLAPIANQFEQYIMNGCIFEFRSTTSDAIASGADISLGTLFMATSYDVLSQDPVDLATFLNMEFSQSGKVSGSYKHMIECARGQTPIQQLYTRSGDVPDNADQRLYDLARFYIGTEGLQTDTPIDIGQLWVTYEVLLFKPRPNAGGSEAFFGSSYSVQGVTGDSGRYLPVVLTSHVNPDSDIVADLATDGTDSIIIAAVPFERDLMINLLLHYDPAVTMQNPTYTLVNAETIGVVMNRTQPEWPSPEAGVLLVNIAAFSFAIRQASGKACAITMTGPLPPTTESEIWIMKLCKQEGVVPD